MAKLGMPTINIVFEEKGIEAIERSTRGILALILEEPKATIDKLLTDHTTGEESIAAITNPFTVYTTDDIPSELSADNKDYLIKALLGYVKSPYRVKVYLQATTTVADGAAAPTGLDKWGDTLKSMATDRWDYLALPTIADADCEAVGTWLKTNRDNKHKRSKVVLPNYAGDYEGIINFTNSKIVTKTKTYTTAEYTPRIAGLLCGTPLTISATYAPLSEVLDVDRHDQDENDEKVNRGEFFAFWDGEKVKMSRAMNSLVTTTQGKLEAYQTIKDVDIMDMIYDDIYNTTDDYYVGKYTNDFDNKILLISAIMGYLKQLEAGRFIQRNYSTMDIDVEAVKNYQLSNGLYTQEELADMSDIEIKKLDTKKKVFLTGKVKILDAMEDFEFHFDI